MGPMDAVSLLHHAARQYCVDRSDQCRRASADGSAGGTNHDGQPDRTWAHSAAADTILNELEQFVPGDFASVEEARAYFAVAAETAQSDTTRFSDPVARAAGDAERRRIAEFVRTVEPDRFPRRPMPFRRVLTGHEHAAWHAAVAARWGNWYGGCADREFPDADAVTLYGAAMEHDWACDQLRAALPEFDRYRYRGWDAALYR